MSFIVFLSWSLQFMITCCDVCLDQSHEHVEIVALETRCLCRKSANSIFFVRICVIKKLSVFVSNAWILSSLRFMFICCCVTERIRDRILLYLIHCFCHSFSWRFLLISMLFLVCSLDWLIASCCSSEGSHHGGGKEYLLWEIKEINSNLSLARLVLKQAN